MAKYITTPEESLKSAEEFIQEFKDLVYPAYASYGIELGQAIILWKLNVITNALSDHVYGPPEEKPWENED